MVDVIISTIFDYEKNTLRFNYFEWNRMRFNTNFRKG